jgi:small subunit ribosomal protein S13
MTALTAFLSAPGNSQMLPKLQLASPHYRPSFQTNLVAASNSKGNAGSSQLLGSPERTNQTGSSTETGKSIAVNQNPKAVVGYGDRLRQLRIETDLRRYVRENIMHHRIVSTPSLPLTFKYMCIFTDPFRTQINSYVGRRHAMGLPVRGQRTNTNGMTARRLNKIERRG